MVAPIIFSKLIPNLAALGLSLHGNIKPGQLPRHAPINSSVAQLTQINRGLPPQEATEFLKNAGKAQKRNSLEISLKESKESLVSQSRKNPIETLPFNRNKPEAYLNEVKERYLNFIAPSLQQIKQQYQTEYQREVGPLLKKYENLNSRYEALDEVRQPTPQQQAEKQRLLDEAGSAILAASNQGLKVFTKYSTQVNNMLKEAEELALQRMKREVGNLSDQQIFQLESTFQDLLSEARERAGVPIPNIGGPNPDEPFGP